MDRHVLKSFFSRRAVRWAVAAGVVVLVLAQGSRSTRDVPEGLAEIREGPIRVWATYDGTLEARNVRYIFAGLGGGATIVEMVPEGAEVKKGDLLVRLDGADFERNLVKSEKDYAMAKAELDSQLNAKLPLELREIEMKLLQTKSDCAKEEQYLEDTRSLVAEGLVADLEVKQQEEKVHMLRMQVENLEQQLALTRDHLHPSVLASAEASLQSAKRDLDLTRAQISNCTIYAKDDGYVAYRPLYVGSEFRAARVGDSIFRNQPFMAIPDMSDLVVQTDVPESEMSMVQTGMTVVVEPLADPNLKLQAVVETVGTMAQNRPNRPDWQKYIHLVISIRTADARLRSGMSVKASILSFEHPSAVLIPRRAVHWENDKPVCKVRHGHTTEPRVLELGRADDQNFVVLSGVKPGERVVLQ